MYCSNCGTDLTDDMEFCYRCGAQQNLAPSISPRRVTVYSTGIFDGSCDERTQTRHRMLFPLAEVHLPDAPDSDGDPDAVPVGVSVTTVSMSINQLFENPPVLAIWRGVTDEGRPRWVVCGAIGGTIDDKDQETPRNVFFGLRAIEGSGCSGIGWLVPGPEQRTTVTVFLASNLQQMKADNTVTGPQPAEPSGEPPADQERTSLGNRTGSQVSVEQGGTPRDVRNPAQARCVASDEYPVRIGHYENHVKQVDRGVQDLLRKNAEQDPGVQRRYWLAYGPDSLELLRNDFFDRLRQHPELLHDGSIEVTLFNRLSDELVAIIDAYAVVQNGRVDPRNPVCMRGIVLRGVISYIGQVGPPADSWWEI